MSPEWNAKMLDEEVKIDSKHHMVIPVSDLASSNLLSHMADAVDFIENAVSTGGTALVHCMAGVSRSSTVGHTHARSHTLTTYACMHSPRRVCMCVHQYGVVWCACTCGFLGRLAREEVSGDRRKGASLSNPFACPGWNIDCSEPWLVAICPCISQAQTPLHRSNMPTTRDHSFCTMSCLSWQHAKEGMWLHRWWQRT